MYQHTINCLPPTQQEPAILNVTQQLFAWMFEKILNDVGHYFVREQYLRDKPDTSLENGLLMTLWYLAKGDMIISVSDLFQCITVNCPQDAKHSSWVNK